MSKRKIVKSEFGRNVLTLMTGTTISQILPLLLTPVLTRLFSPEEFGAYAFYMSLVTFLLVIATGRYEQAIVLPKEDKEAINVLALSVGMSIGFSVLLSLVILLFNDGISALIGQPQIADWLWFLPISVLFGSTYKIFTLWSNRKKRFKGTSSGVIGQTSARIGWQLGGSFFKFESAISKKGLIAFVRSTFDKNYQNPVGITPIGVGALIISHTFGFFVGTIMLLFSFLKKDISLWTHVNKAEIKSQARIYKKFPMINAAHAMSDEIKNIGVNSLILFLFSKTILGYYSITVRVLRAPLSVIGTSFAQVFYQKAAEMHAHGQNFIPLIYSTVKKMLLIAIAPFLVVFLFGPDLFDFILGSEWRIAGVYAQYLTPWLFLSFAIAPVLQVSVILNKQGQYFIVSLVHNIIILGSILVGGFVFDDLTTGFLILSCLQVGFYFFVFNWAIWISKRELEPKDKAND